MASIYLEDSDRELVAEYTVTPETAGNADFTQHLLDIDVTGYHYADTLTRPTQGVVDAITQRQYDALCDAILWEYEG